MAHPCCNAIPTAQAAKYVALCDLVFGVVGIFWFVFILEGYGLIDKDDLYDYLYETDTFVPPARIRVVTSSPSFFNNTRSIDNTTQQHNTIQYFSIFTVSSNGIGIDGELGNICLSGFYTAMNIALFVLLLSAINKRCVIKLSIWFWIRAFIQLLKFLLFVTYIALGLSVMTQTPHLIFMLVHLYGLWIVGTLIKEIKEERKSAASGPVTISHNYLANTTSIVLEGSEDSSK